jgi:hypothetical protein
MIKKDENKPIRLGLTLEGEMLKRFLTIKKKWGLESNADVVRFLITQEYEKIIKS